MHLLSSFDLQNQLYVCDSWESDIRGPLWHFWDVSTWLSLMDLKHCVSKLELVIFLSQICLPLYSSKYYHPVIQVRSTGGTLTTSLPQPPGPQILPILLPTYLPCHCPYLTQCTIWFPCLCLGFSPATPLSNTADQMISVVPDSALRAWMASWACQYFLHSFI